MIIRNLRFVIIQDYSTEDIESMVPSFAPEKIINKSRDHHMIVCLHGDDLVGTASLDGDKVRNVFVDTEMHKRGIGRFLMAAIEDYAHENGLKTTYLHSGLSAQGFYRKLGYETVERAEQELDGILIEMIKMEKDLSKV